MLHICIIHRNGHFGYQYVGLFFSVPFIIIRSNGLAFISIIDA